ncbi:MAG TPA: response regulator [Chthoniobacteraceae bacterium]|nr:response regulator [Chthoniobacteraceae bacterium]
MPSKNLNILLADDEDEIASLVSSVLIRAGHSVDLASDGQAALDLLKDNPARYDLIITDSNMPAVSGLELIEYLRKTGYPGKIILLSGYAADLEKEYKILNIDRIMQKPFAFADLIGAVKEATSA